MIFQYCERTTNDFFDEPLNSLTNFLFVIVAFLLYKKYPDKIILPAIIFLIGIASFLFHSIPSNFTGLLDIFFIICFLFFYTYKIYQNKLSLKKTHSIFIAIIFILVSYFIGILLSISFLNASSYYLGIIVHLIFLCFLFRIRKVKKQILRYINLATFLFIVSLTLRTLDNYICDNFYLGTHFFWHICNSFVLYFLVIFYYLLPNRPAPKKPT